jgi:hypothetical protein
VVGPEPIVSRKGKRALARLKGKIDLPDEFFFDPLPEKGLRLWERADGESTR